MINKNPLNDFIVDKYRERQAKLHSDDDFILDGDEVVKSVTVRLPVDTLHTVDSLAKYLDISRQQLMYSFFEGGISTALSSLAYASVQAKGLLPDMPTHGDTSAYDEEVERLVEAERSDFIKAIVL